VLTNKLLGNILQEQVLGKTTEDINGEICSTFMLQPLGAKSISLKAESIAADLQRQLLVDPARQSETLLKQRTRTRRIHEPARQLLTKVSEMMRRQESTVLPGCRTRWRRPLRGTETKVEGFTKSEAAESDDGRRAADGAAVS
jgi:hypothetical protein